MAQFTREGGHSMSIGSISGSTPNAAGVPQKPQEAEEQTTVTTHCKEKHQHDQSCPHTVSTQPAPKMGEPGYLMDEKA